MEKRPIWSHYFQDSLVFALQIFAWGKCALLLLQFISIWNEQNEHWRTKDRPRKTSMLFDEKVEARVDPFYGTRERDR